METKISAALFAAVVCLPNDLCRIIGGYAGDRWHRWTAAGLSETATCKAIDDRTTELAVADKKGESNRWNIFVSDRTLADGDGEWTIECPRRSGCSGWIGIGLTTIVSNRLTALDNGYYRAAESTDWILAELSGSWQLVHDGSFRLPYLSGMADRISFQADPSTGVIRIRPVGLVAVETNWYGYCKTMPAFASLRPCVALAGPISAIVRSGPADDAAGVSDVYFITASV